MLAAARRIDFARGLHAQAMRIRLGSESSSLLVQPLRFQHSQILPPPPPVRRAPPHESHRPAARPPQPSSGGDQQPAGKRYLVKSPANRHGAPDRFVALPPVAVSFRYNVLYLLGAKRQTPPSSVLRLLRRAGQIAALVSAGEESVIGRAQDWATRSAAAAALIRAACMVKLQMSKLSMPRSHPSLDALVHAVFVGFCEDCRYDTQTIRMLVTQLKGPELLRLVEAIGERIDTDYARYMREEPARRAAAGLPPLQRGPDGRCTEPLPPALFRQWRPALLSLHHTLLVCSHRAFLSVLFSAAEPTPRAASQLNPFDRLPTPSGAGGGGGRGRAPGTGLRAQGDPALRHLRVSLQRMRMLIGMVTQVARMPPHASALVRESVAAVFKASGPPLPPFPLMAGIARAGSEGGNGGGAASAAERHAGTPPELHGKPPRHLQSHGGPDAQAAMQCFLHLLLREVAMAERRDASLLLGVEQDTATTALLHTVTATLRVITAVKHRLGVDIVASRVPPSPLLPVPPAPGAAATASSSGPAGATAPAGKRNGTNSLTLSPVAPASASRAQRDAAAAAASSPDAPAIVHHPLVRQLHAATERLQRRKVAELGPYFASASSTFSLFATSRWEDAVHATVMSLVGERALRMEDASLVPLRGYITDAGTVADAAWPAHRVCLEYDGSEVHSALGGSSAAAAAAAASRAARRSAPAASGSRMDVGSVVTGALAEMSSREELGAGDDEDEAGAGGEEGVGVGSGGASWSVSPEALCHVTAQLCEGLQALLPPFVPAANARDAAAPAWRPPPSVIAAAGAIAVTIPLALVAPQLAAARAVPVGAGGAGGADAEVLRLPLRQWVGPAVIDKWLVRIDGFRHFNAYRAKLVAEGRWGKSAGDGTGTSGNDNTSDGNGMPATTPRGGDASSASDSAPPAAPAAAPAAAAPPQCLGSAGGPAADVDGVSPLAECPLCVHQRARPAVQGGAVGGGQGALGLGSKAGAGSEFDSDLPDGEEGEGTDDGMNAADSWERYEAAAAAGAAAASGAEGGGRWSLHATLAKAAPLLPSNPVDALLHPRALVCTMPINHTEVQRLSSCLRALVLAEEEAALRRAAAAAAGSAAGVPVTPSPSTAKPGASSGDRTHARTGAASARAAPASAAAAAPDAPLGRPENDSTRLRNAMVQAVGWRLVVITSDEWLRWTGSGSDAAWHSDAFYYSRKLSREAKQEIVGRLVAAGLPLKLHV